MTFSTGDLDLLFMLILGATSSLHCTGMCGPIIAVASAPVTIGEKGNVRRPKRMAFWQAQYHLGRGITYSLLGLLLGLLGTSVAAIPHARQVGGGIQLTLGALIAFAGVWQLLGRKTQVVGQASDGLLTRALRTLIRKGQARGMLGLGLLTGFLPCGVLYVAFARATVAGSGSGGAAVMAAFWLGTVPLLATVGLASGGLAHLMGRYRAILLFVAMVGTGGWVANRGAHQLLAQGHAGMPARTQPSPSSLMERSPSQTPSQGSPKPTDETCPFHRHLK
jgi:uncharacterized protein